MIDEMPDPHRFSAPLAALSPKQQIPARQIRLPRNHLQRQFAPDKWLGNELRDTYITKSMRWALDLELEATGPDPAFGCAGPDPA